MKSSQYNYLWFITVFLIIVFTPEKTIAKPLTDSNEMTSFQLYSGDKARQLKAVDSQPPNFNRSKQNWDQFKSKHQDGEWKSIWDQDTGVPLRIYGSGLAAPRTIESPHAAEHYARTFLGLQMDLLAPGSSVDDFSLVSNVVHNGLRVVGFKQSYKGYSVIGGQLSFRFKNNRLVAIASEALPFVKVNDNSKKASFAKMESQALNWIQADIDINAKLKTPASKQLILPIIKLKQQSYAIEYVLVRRIVIKSQQPMGQWDVFIDANSGEPVARQQKLMFAAGTAFYNAPERWPGSSRMDYPAPHVNLDVNGGNEISDNAGVFIWDGGANASVNTSVNGTYVTVINSAGAQASSNFIVADSGFLIWSEASVEFSDSQLTSFIHTNRVRDYVKPWNPSLAWLDQTITVTVNINDTCNAFSDGDSINFFSESAQCSNTGRLADVIYHEYGHSLHIQSIIQGVGSFDGAMSEGVGDFLAATLNSDSATGVGFFLDNNPLREINPVGTEAVYPDDLSGDIHISGLIYAGAFWDLRQALIDKLGLSAGVETTERLFYATLQRSTDMTTAYVEALIEDDDDGNLANGTPNYCEIDESFGLHGLNIGSSNSLFGSPSVDGLNVSVPSVNTFGCTNTINEMTLEWQKRSDPGLSGSFAMTPSATSFNAVLPFNEPGEVVQFRFIANYSNGHTDYKPKNNAAPWYERFIGITNVITCNDFETDPFLEGWTHALTAGTDQPGADDWQWGGPLGTLENADPTEAYSGNSIIGNDIGLDGFNGLYQSSIVNQTISPVFDVSAYEFVRLQYRRWLNVEDGFYDQAKIYANDIEVWSNYTSQIENEATVHHQDKEWRFHDVDLTAEILNDEVQLRFEVSSDGSLEFGGWTIDDVCLVGYNSNVQSDVIYISGFD